jgi:hypothetical protein
MNANAASTASVADAAQDAPAWLGRLHRLLAVQSLFIVLLSLNRLGPWTLGELAPDGFLRWVDFHNLLTLPLISLVAMVLTWQHLERGRGEAGPGRRRVELLFLLGLYLYGAGYGVHEVTNYLHARYCDQTVLDEALCRIVVFNDDGFSHWIYFIGFSMINAALVLLQALLPFRGTLARRDLVLLGVNALFIALGIFANLGFEEIGLDLYVVAFLAALSLWLWRRVGRQPVIVYYSLAYCLGLAATAVVKLLG